MLAGGESRGYQLLGVFVVQFLQGEGTGVGNLYCRREEFGGIELSQGDEGS
jgi:hypothetical protein